MEIKKTIYYDVAFKESEEEKAAAFIEKLNKKGYEDMCAGVKKKKDGRKWLSGADSAGGYNGFDYVAQVFRITFLKDR